MMRHDPPSDPENKMLHLLLQKARDQRKAYKKYFQQLRRMKPDKLDKKFHEKHEEAFRKVNCSDCANCCKTTSPIFRPVDIDRLAQHLRIQPSKLIDQHLHIDEDGDYVINKSPCPFLGENNQCEVYAVRPQACRGYPHTDRKRMHQILDITLKNTRICPAVSHMVAQMIEKK